MLPPVGAVYREDGFVMFDGMGLGGPDDEQGDSSGSNNTNNTAAANTPMDASTSAGASSASASSASAPLGTRRHAESGDVDDIFAQICSRMGALSTEVKDNKPEVIEIFRSVLMCSEMEALFFLESAGWEIAAVSTRSLCT